MTSPRQTSRANWGSVLLLALSSSPLAAMAEDKLDLNCNNWSLNSAVVNGPVVTYGLKAQCVLTETIEHTYEGNWTFKGTVWFNLDLKSAYSSATHHAVETITLTPTGGSSNNDWGGNNSNHVSHSIPSNQLQAVTVTQRANCEHDPDPGSMQPPTHCKNHNKEGWNQWPFSTDIHVNGHTSQIPLTVQEMKPPYFFAYEHVDAQAANILKAQAHNAEVLAQEEGGRQPHGDRTSKWAKILQSGCHHPRTDSRQV